MNRGKRDLLDHLLIALLQLIGKFRGLILVPVFLRHFGAAAYGEWVQVILLVSLLAPSLQGAMHLSLLRFAPGTSRARQGELYWNGLAWVVSACALGTGVGYWLAPFIATALDVPPALLSTAMLLVFPRGLTRYLANQLRTEGRSKIYSSWTTLELVTEVVCVSAAALWNHELLWVVWVMVALEWGASILLGVGVSRRLPFVRPSWTVLRPMLAYSLPGVPSGLNQFLLNFGDRYIISFFLGPAAVGIYSAAYGLCLLPAFPQRALMVTLPSRASRAWNEGDKAGAGRLMRDYISAYNALSLPMVAGLLVTGVSILTYLAGESFQEWTPTLVASLLFASWLSGLVPLLWISFQLSVNTALLARLTVIAAVLNVAANFVLVPRFGITGAAVATVIACAANLVAAVWYCQRVVGPTVPWGQIARTVAAAAGMAVVVSFVPQRPALWLGVAVGVGVITYAAAAGMTGAVSLAKVKALLR